MKKYYYLFVMSLLILGACLDNGTNTAVLPPINTNVGNVSPSTETISLEEFVPDSIFEVLEAEIPIYEGDTPPDVTGAYLISEMWFESSSSDLDAVNRKINDYEICFKNNMAHYEGQHRIDESNYESSDTVYVTGSGDNFTAYFIGYGENQGVWRKSSTVISGTLTDDGIKDIYFTQTILEKGDDSQISSFIPLGRVRVFIDKDGLAENHTWTGR